MTIDQKKDFAKLLFVRERLTQKEVAARAQISEQTMVKWVKEGNWEKLRRSLLVTKQEQVIRLYDQIEALNDIIAEQQEGIPDSKQADVLTKITAAIRNLETEVNIGERVEVCMELCDHVRSVAPDKSSDMVSLCDSFIKAQLKR